MQPAASSSPHATQFLSLLLLSVWALGGGPRGGELPAVPGAGSGDPKARSLGKALALSIWGRGGGGAAVA